MQAKKAARRAKIEELKAARDGGKREYSVSTKFPNVEAVSHSRTAQVQETDAIYDEVDDDDYKSIVKGRLQEDDFIEDDDGSGYIDNGMDDWDREDRQEDDKKCTFVSLTVSDRKLISRLQQTQKKSRNQSPPPRNR